MLLRGLKTASPQSECFLSRCVVVFTVAGAFVRRIELQCGESTGHNLLSRLPEFIRSFVH